MVVCDGSEVVVGARKNLPQIFVSEVDEKGSLRRRQVADDGEDKVKYIPGTTSTPSATRYPQTYGTFETQAGSYVPSPSSMDGNLHPMATRNPQNPQYLQVPVSPHHDSPPMATRNPQNPQYLQVPVSPRHDSPPRKTMNPQNPQYLQVPLSPRHDSPQYLQVPLSPRHDSPPRKKSRDEFGLSLSSASVGDSGFHDDSLFRGHDSDASYRGHDSDASYRGYGKTSQLPGLDESYSDGTSSRSWKRSRGLDGGVWNSISSPVEDLRRRIKGRASFTDESVPWIDVSKRQVMQGICVFVLVTSIAFGLVGFARHFQTSPLEESFSHGKYRSIEMGAKMWRDKMEMWRDKMAEEGRVLSANIVDGDGNVLLGGKKAAIQFAHDLNNKADKVTFPEDEVAVKRQDSIDEGGLMKDSKEVVSRESRSPMKDNDEKDEVKSIKELTEEIRQIAEMLKKRDSGLDEKVQTDYDYDEFVLRNQLEEKNRKKKQLVQKINDFGHFSSGRVAPLSRTSKSKVQVSNDDLFDGDVENDQDDIDDEILEQDLNNAEDLDEIIEVNITPDSETDEVSQFDSINENAEVADEFVEDNFDQKKAEEQLKLLLDEFKVKTKKLEERKAMKIKKASKKKTKNKNPFKELANRSKKVTKAVKSTAMKSKASDESSKVIDLNTDEDLSDAFEEKFKGDEVTKNRRDKE